jgi:hypothetical protein
LWSLVVGVEVLLRHHNLEVPVEVLVVLELVLDYL